MQEPEEPLLLAPPEIDGIQVNFCKNPACPNYSVPVTGVRNTNRGTVDPTLSPPRYKPASTMELQLLTCQACKETFPIKSNKGIKEELDRHLPFPRQVEPIHLCCPNVNCNNHNLDVESTPGAYYTNGKTITGSQRYKCKICKSTFTDVLKTSTISRHKKSHRNASIFLDLINKVPLKAIARKNSISMKTVYDKIDFIYKQCRAFVAHRERELPNITKKRMEIAVDRQVHKINWKKSTDKRNIDLYAIGSADAKSGYVFGVHVNYDFNCDKDLIEANAVMCGDYDLKPPFREYARFWLAGDYEEAARIKKAIAEREAKKKEKRKSAAELVDETYSAAVAREDIEACEVMDATCQLPLKGMQIHSDYTMYAHFMFLQRMLKGVDYIRFYLDQDSGIRAACLAAFVDRVLAKECDAFFVKIRKELSQAEKLSRVSKWQWQRDEFVAKNTEYEEQRDFIVRLAMILERMGKLSEHGKWKDKWLEHPFVTMSEPEKMVCYLTNLKASGFDYDLDRMALMYDRASLHAIDRFFMQVRRAVSILERAISSSSTGGRRWYGYSAYRPDIVVKLLEIFRVYHNYVQMNEGKKRKRLKEGEQKRKRGEARKIFTTPAMRLGLASGQVRIEDILYFMP
ncbi:hypothetical protein OR1_03213 [Geobacter sp. OR-1]|uniref:hypothetical protein n=1 Tax=Geobacter sp. OR-1 TaxID=1266765 RepID=UPI00054240BC|nr:hypothetical protein [Geobacter sp. OR-1]GAM10913.1 hypothetical protein OR1_03213 [Geobacter sp. OR-1]